MQWEQRSYLRLCIAHSIAIDTTHYPGGRVKSLRNATKADVQKLIALWGDGTIKWVKLTPEEVESRRDEYEAIRRRQDPSKASDNEDSSDEDIPTPP